MAILVRIPFPKAVVGDVDSRRTDVRRLLVLDQPKEGYWGYWAVVDRGIYFIDPETKPHATIKLFSFATRRVMQIAAIEKKPYPGIPGLAVSPDGRWILYTQLDQSGSDIMLVENFR